MSVEKICNHYYQPCNCLTMYCNKSVCKWCHQQKENERLHPELEAQLKHMTEEKVAMLLLDNGRTIYGTEKEITFIQETILFNKPAYPKYDT